MTEPFSYQISQQNKKTNVHHLFTLLLLFIATLLSFNTIASSDFDSFPFINDHTTFHPTVICYIDTIADSTSQYTTYSYDYTNDNTYSSPYTNTIESSYDNSSYQSDTLLPETPSAESTYQDSHDTQSPFSSPYFDDNWGTYSARDYDPLSYSSSIDHSNSYDSYTNYVPNNDAHSLPSPTATQAKQQSPTTVPTQSAPIKNTSKPPSIPTPQTLQQSISAQARQSTQASKQSDTVENRHALIEQNIQDSASYLNNCVDTYVKKIAKGECNKREATRWQTRIQAINTSKNNNNTFTTQSYSLSKQATYLLDIHSISTDIFKRCDGTALQQCIQQEVITIVNQAATIYYKAKPLSIDLLSRTLSNLAHATIEYNLAGYIKEALTVTDCCWGLLNITIGITKGAYDAAYDSGYIAKNVILHPIEAGADLVYNTATALWYMGKVLHEVCGITIECVVTPESGLNHLEEALGNVGTVTSALWRQLQQMSLQEKTRAITKNAVKSLITKKCVGALHVFYKDSQTKLISLAKKIKQSAKPIPAPVFAGCPEGYFANESANILFLLRKNKKNKIEPIKEIISAQANKQLPQKIVQEAVNNGKPLKAYNMQQFFKEFEFGKLLKKHSIKTSKRYKRQSVYRINETMNEHFRKGYYFYLDDLHYDHLEVFNTNGIAQTVVNLDGVENLTKKMQAIKQARILW